MTRITTSVQDRIGGVNRAMFTVALIVAAVVGGACANGGKTPSASSASTPSAADAPAVAVGRYVVERLAAGDPKGAERDFDATMRSGLGPGKLGELWDQLQAQNGAFTEIAGTRVDRVGGHTLVFVQCRFAHGNLDLQVTVSHDERVAGMFVRPGTAPATTGADAGAATEDLPDYAEPSSFRQVQVKIGSGPASLPGTLTLPRTATKARPVPAIVLVHGSGPSDRDEHVGALRPFRDLAAGLASRGIAVLRYDKRSFAHPESMSNATVTIDSEAIDDALAAVDLLTTRPEIDAQQIVVVGHSLGAAAAPRIAERAGDRVLGVIALAAPTAPFGKTLLRQTTYIAKGDGSISAEEQHQLDALRPQAEKVDDPKLSRSTPGSKLPFGIGAQYWLSVRALQPVATAVRVGKPILVLQGGRDYQVTVKDDLPAWEAGLRGKGFATIKQFPTLTHAFTVGGTPPSPMDYAKPAHVDVAVIDTIAHWIQSLNG